MSFLYRYYDLPMTVRFIRLALRYPLVNCNQKLQGIGLCGIGEHFIMKIVFAKGVTLVIR
ncbi:hypothetical protein AQ1_01313 [alpha proteobacterium Q-1]|nr:hypothetical protein AQ1_01313 [alpha proteobacterium Q-1]